MMARADSIRAVEAVCCEIVSVAKSPDNRNLQAKTAIKTGVLLGVAAEAIVERDPAVGAASGACSD